MSETFCWEAPAPLEGVKSRKRVIFGVESAKVAVGSDVSRIANIKITLASRIAATGTAGRAICEVLLGTRPLVEGKADRHTQLHVVRLGPETAGCPAEVAAALELRPQVVILDGAPAEHDTSWAQTFHNFLCSNEVHDFRGAVIVCAAAEDAAVRSMCTERWEGSAGWIWQESITSRVFEIMEDVLGTHACKDSGNCIEDLLAKACVLSDDCFQENAVEKAQEKGWVLSLLTEKMEDGSKELRGFLSHSGPAPPKAELHVARLAVPREDRHSGYGQRLLMWILQKAALMPRSQCAWISLSSLDTAVSFYEKFGFMDMTCDAVDDPDHFQTWMELQNFPVVPEVELPIEESE